MIKCVIFDLDGTLLNTLGDLQASVNFALNKNGLPPRSEGEVCSFIGNGIRLLIERSVPENTPDYVTDSCFSDFKEHYKSNNAVLTKPYDGISEMLAELSGKGIKLAVVSNKADFAVQSLVKRYFGDVFHCAVGEREGINRKPAPDTVLEVMRILNVNNTEVLYVGDSDVDIKTAENAGIPAVSVAWGFRNKAFLQSFKPNYIIDCPEEILAIL